MENARISKCSLLGIADLNYMFGLWAKKEVEIHDVRCYMLRYMR